LAFTRSSKANPPFDPRGAALALHPLRIGSLIMFRLSRLKGIVISLAALVAMLIDCTVR
jgi:hypothetical protein